MVQTISLIDVMYKKKTGVLYLFFVFIVSQQQSMGYLASVKQHLLRMSLTIGKMQQKDLVAINKVFLTVRLSLNGLH